MYKRILDFKNQLTKRSLFLFGPRSTGKSTLLRHLLPDAHYYDLLDSQVFSRLVRRPGLIGEESHPDSIVVIDEIQKLPILLDEVHRLIAARDQRFVLTGSSARKLKRGAANLLAGRARWLQLFPLVSAEIPDFNLETYLRTGGLPQIYGDDEAHIDLKSYVDLYLREEIQAEALTRNIHGFARLLDILGITNGEEINYASIASDTGLQAKTVSNYVEILQDTLLAFTLPVFQKTKKRKATSRAKLYFFDVGVVNSLCKRTDPAVSPESFGRAFEHFIILEVRAYLSYKQLNEELRFWRSRSGFEVDLLVGDHLSIEIKTSYLISDKHLKGLRALKEEFPSMRSIVVSQDSKPRKTEDRIEIVPYLSFLDDLWNGRIV